jgi:ASC-1-like (ASCH) protein
MVDMARMEERMVTAFKRMDNIVEYQKKADDRLDEMEKQAIARGQKIAFAERIFWMVCTGAVGLAFVYLR